MDADLALIEGFLPADRRQKLMLFEALMHEIRQSGFHSSDSRVGQAKLIWWGEELSRLDAAGGSHPLIRALLGLGAPNAVAAPLWQGLISGALAQLDSEPALDFEQRAQQLSILSVAETEIRLRLSGVQVPDTPSGLPQAWMWIALWLWRMPEQSGLRDWLLPINTLAAARCTRDALETRPLGEDACRLVRLMSTTVASGLRSSAAEIIPGDLLGSARHALALQAVHRLQGQPQLLFSAREKIRPLQRLWATWRTARRQRLRQD